MTVHSTLKRSEYEIKAMERKKAELEVLPPIDFWHVNEEDEDDDKYEKAKDLYVTIEVPFDNTLPEDDDNRKTYSAKIKVFKNGTPEEYCAHRTALHELATKLGVFLSVKNDDGDYIDVDDNVITENQVRDQEADILIPLAKSTLRGTASIS